MSRPWWKSKTSWGVILAAAGQLVGQIATIAPSAALTVIGQVVTAVGAAVAGVGLSDKADKHTEAVKNGS